MLPVSSVRGLARTGLSQEGLQRYVRHQAHNMTLTSSSQIADTQPVGAVSTLMRLTQPPALVTGLDGFDFDVKCISDDEDTDDSVKNIFSSLLH